MWGVHLDNFGCNFLHLKGARHHQIIHSTMAAAMLRFNRQRANTIIARRHGDSTDAGYESSRGKFKVWMKNYYPEGLTGTNDDLIDDRHIILPLHVDATLTFLGEAERLKLVGENIEQIPADQPPIAVSTMTGIASSISDLYKSNNMVMDETLKNEISKFMKGYRVVGSYGDSHEYLSDISS